MADSLALPTLGQEPTQGGLASPLLGVLGALAPAVQGFMQGREFRDSEQDRARKQAMDTLQLITQMGQGNPGIATDPNVINQVRGAYGRLGLSAPMRTVAATQPGQQATQELDTSALGWTPTFEGWTEKNIGSIEQLEPNQRASVYKALGITATPDQLSTISQLPFLPDPAEQARVSGQIQNGLWKLSMGNASISQFRDYLRSIQPLAARYNIDTNTYLDDPSLGNLGAAATAKINELQSLGWLDKTRANTLIEQTPSIIQRNLSSSNLSNVRAQYIPNNFRLASQRVQIALRNSNARTASLLPALQSKNLGVVTQAVNSLRQQRDSDQRQLDELQKSAKSLSDDILLGGTSNPQVEQAQKAAQALQQKVNEETAALDQFSGGQSTMLTNYLHGQGVPLNYRVPGADGGGGINPNSPPPGTQYSASRKQYRTPDGKIYNADGSPAQ